MAEEYTVEIELQPHKRGDQWQGIPQIGPVIINGVTPSDQLTRVRMHFRTRGDALFRLDSDPDADPDAPITINDAVTWDVTVPPVDKFIQLDQPWSWDMEFWSGSPATPLTLYRGTLKVYGDTTR